jgi:hypothetical protein
LIRLHHFFLLSLMGVIGGRHRMPPALRGTRCGHL